MCTIFCSSGYHGSNPGVLVSQPLTAFHKALELFHKHAEKGYHEDAVIKYDEFLQVMTNQKPNQLSQAMTDRIASNRQKLSSIIQTIVLCGRQNIALCGHCDNATDIEKDPLNTEHFYISEWMQVILFLVNILKQLLRMLPTHLLLFKTRSLMFLKIRLEVKL